MKIPPSFLLLSIASLTSIREIAAQCYDYTDALDLNARIPTSCKLVDKIEIPTPPTKAPAESSKFIIDYKCEIQTNQDLCARAQRSIQKVCEILTENLSLRKNINVDVSLKDLCPTDAQQSCNELGGAGFARTMELLDDDDIIREYPTALVKQFDCDQHYEFGDVDIRAVFNGGNATSLWFEGDPQITSDQIDFRRLVLKKFINALGVKTSWIEQPIFDKVSPTILTPQLTLSQENGGDFEFKGFKEYAYDKYIIFRGKELQSIHDAAKSLDEFVKEPDVKFKDQEEFIAQLVKSPQIEAAQRMANVSVNPFTLGFLPRGAKSDDDVIVLETSFNPYQNDVSMNNFDASIYADTEDFLMVSTLTSGKTLEDSMGKFLSPLGPRLISLLETLGYPTKKLPENDFKTNTEVILTKTTYVVTEIKTVSKSVVTVIEIVTGPPPQQTLPPTNNNPSQDDDNNDVIDNFGQDIFNSSSFNIQNNLTLMFIALVCCILGSLNTI
ncbi:7680_t:CDS:2 [Funneliformis mosseae]|uniref:7680_t:CDS:1 n=1 Tax=Funneliformis mosseae TaxID=27381 RepID=A0A9N8Z9Z0_FUNMO|nr:7680_t:CDS:2 [Funneliformis mosseae]